MFRFDPHEGWIPEESHIEIDHSDSAAAPMPHPNCRSYGGTIVMKATPEMEKLVSTLVEQTVLKYLWLQVIQKGRDYVSLDRMAKDLALRYDQCETFVAKFHAERKIPRLAIVEEVEG